MLLGISLLALVSSLSCFCQATQDSTPRLEKRQGTMLEVANLTYPLNFNNASCPYASLNLWDGQTMKSSLTNVKRSLDDTLHTRQAPQNGTCSTVAWYNFTDWIGGALPNSPTATLSGGVTYWYSVAFNVPILAVQVWTVPQGSNKYSMPLSINNQGNNALIAFTPANTVNVHFQIDFSWGNPKGQMVLLTNSTAPPPLQPAKPQNS